MSEVTPKAAKITKLDLAIALAAMVLITVIALPRYTHQAKLKETRQAINQLQTAAAATLEELGNETGEKGKPEEALSDEEWLTALKKHLGRQVPLNPFTGSGGITVKHLATLSPCDYFDASGGWLWNLAKPPSGGDTLKSGIWLNSDTTHIGRGMGEACIQP